MKNHNLRLALVFLSSLVLLILIGLLTNGLAIYLFDKIFNSAFFGIGEWIVSMVPKDNMLLGILAIFACILLGASGLVSAFGALVMLFFFGYQKLHTIYKDSDDYLFLALNISPIILLLILGKLRDVELIASFMESAGLSLLALFSALAISTVIIFVRRRKKRN